MKCTGESQEYRISNALRVPQLIYLINATLLICHEIDSGYWREWELFHIPGGATGFVALHIPLIAILLWGMVQIARGSRTWCWYSVILGIAGTCGGLLHLAFLVAGNESFTTWFSVSLIVAFLMTSITQLVVTCAWWSSAEQANEDDVDVSPQEVT